MQRQRRAHSPPSLPYAVVRWLTVRRNLRCFAPSKEPSFLNASTGSACPVRARSSDLPPPIKQSKLKFSIVCVARSRVPVQSSYVPVHSHIFVTVGYCARRKEALESITRLEKCENFCAFSRA